MTIQLTYHGTAMLDLQLGSTRLLTDPTLDPAGTHYDFGLWCTPRAWFASEKQYATPPLAPGRFDAVLLSHDHHADNFDAAGRALASDPAQVDRVVTTVPGARRLRLGARGVGLAPGAQLRIGDATVTATRARHGPWYAPQASQVVGFLIDVDHGPRLWLSGDTVLFPALADELAAIGRARPVDVAVIHCGAVGFPRAPGFARARFTFDAREAIAAAELLRATTLVPVHRAGWAHFRESEAALAAALAGSPYAERSQLLALGARLSV